MILPSHEIGRQIGWPWTVYPTREHARADIARYVEVRYNTQRLHSGLGYKTPLEVHNEYLNRQQRA